MNACERISRNRGNEVRLRYLGHSCVEILGRHHILIDPDFTRPPEGGVEHICITHAHSDHIGRVMDVPKAWVVASANVCEAALRLGVSHHRLISAEPGWKVANVEVLQGFSRVNDPIYSIMYMLFRRRLPEAGGSPLSFLIHDEVSVLHIGDAHDAPLPVSPDVLCLPWRSTPFWADRYKARLIQLAEQFGSPYVLPVHHDMPPNDADPEELRGRLEATVLDGEGWHVFEGNRLSGRDN